MKWQIAIDGPAGAGKSTIAKEVAKKLCFEYLDTGAMYRAVTLKALNLKINLNDENNYNFLENTSINFKEHKILLDGNDVSNDIRSLEVTNNVSLVSKFKYVRDKMVTLQRQISNEGKIILDGRDIGTVVLPNANLKVYLTATVEERAKRRMIERELKGNNNQTLEETIKEIEARDYKDSHREISPLKKADDAIEVDTTSLCVNEVIDLITRLVMERGYKMENVKTNVEGSVEEVVEEVVEETVTTTETEQTSQTVEETPVVDEMVAEKATEKEETINTLKELQLVEGVVIEVQPFEKEVVKKGEVVRKAKEERVVVDLGNDQEGLLFRKDVLSIDDNDDLADVFLEGDKIQAIVKKVFPDGGKVLLSTILLAKREEIKKYEDVIANHGVFTAKVVKAIKVGLILEHEGYACLLPTSQVSVEEDKVNSLVGTEIEVAPIRVDYNRIRLIVSQTVATAIKTRAEKQEFVSSIKVGQVFEGKVKNIESYGAFVELGNGVEGLLHISEVEHNRIVKMEKALAVGDVVKVQVIKVDNNHIGLSRKALLPNYWKDFIDANPVDTVTKGNVVEINKAGVVVTLSENVQGFLPRSEFAWERDTFIEDYVTVGDSIEVKVIELDLSKKRIILSRKQLNANPWETLNLKAGDSVNATVVKVLAEGVKVNVEGASGFLPKNNVENASELLAGSQLNAKVKVFDPSKTKLIITTKEDVVPEKTLVNKYLKTQEKVTSTFGDFLDLSQFTNKSKKK